jgi:hypothetical protein
MSGVLRNERATNVFFFFSYENYCPLAIFIKFFIIYLFIPFFTLLEKKKIKRKAKERKRKRIVALCNWTGLV